jgi:hypothetical protein
VVRRHIDGIFTNGQNNFRGRRSNSLVLYLAEMPGRATVEYAIRSQNS